MSGSDWSSRRRRELWSRIEKELDERPKTVAGRQNVRDVKGRRVRAGFGRPGMVPGDGGRAVPGYPPDQVEPFYFQIPGPVGDDDIVIAALGEDDLIFSGREFKRVAGPYEFEHERYVPSVFRVLNTDQHYARVDGREVPIGDAVDRWTLLPGWGSSSAMGAAPTSSDRATHDEEDTDLLANFRPKNSDDYVARIRGRQVTKTRRHESLIEQYGRHVAEKGIAPSTLEHPKDLVLRRGREEWLVEAKVIGDAGNAVSVTRAALGQLYWYRKVLVGSPTVKLVALFDSFPGPLCVDFLVDAGVEVVWQAAEDWDGTPGAAEDGLC